MGTYIDHYFEGIPFNETANFRLEIAEVGQSILGNKLIGLQVGNEPDLYSRHGHRDAVRHHTFLDSFLHLLIDRNRIMALQGIPPISVYWFKHWLQILPLLIPTC